ncbi:hypothetical protein BSKO_13652 [Bryopsis sp. KO-2023]|nr:hypothetical protein BSKO_13652 [Bryopsis sp. KO-2023]
MYGSVFLVATPPFSSTRPRRQNWCGRPLLRCRPGRSPALKKSRQRVASMASKGNPGMDDSKRRQSDNDAAAEANQTTGDVARYRPTVPVRAKWLLYVSHALSTWGERAWEFAVGLVILDLYNNSLREVSLYGLASALGAVLFGPSVGRFIDRTPRFRTVAVFYFIQNVGMALAAVSSLALLWNGPRTMEGPLALALLGSVIFWGVFGAVGFLGSTVSVEKEWTRALCGDDEHELAIMNSSLRTIDLGCLILAPVLTGFLMTYCGMRIAVMEIAGFNLLAWFPEVLFAKYAQNAAPQLQVQKFETSAPSPEEGDLEEPLIANSKGEKEKGLATWGVFQAIALYYKQKCSLAMFALALLYLTVLSLGLLMTSYLKSLGMSEATLSLYRGVGAVTGVLGAKAFPFFQKTLGLPATGLMGAGIQFVSLAVGVVPLVCRAFMSTSDATLATMHLLVWGLIISRFGLWTFDLTVSQTMQMTVDSTKLGSVGGVQKMHENFFTVVLYVVVVFVNDPKDFVWLMMGSLGVVGTAMSLYMIHMCKSRAAMESTPASA